MELHGPHKRVCPVCGKQVQHRCNMTRHIASHHKTVHEANPADAETQAEDSEIQPEDHETQAEVSETLAQS